MHRRFKENEEKRGVIWWTANDFEEGRWKKPRIFPQREIGDINTQPDNYAFKDSHRTTQFYF